LQECAAEGIRVVFAGECPTGVGSALVPYMKLAGSMNFTPSHNPMDYAGLKFNPADGGPAPPEITDVIQVHSGPMGGACIRASYGCGWDIAMSWAIFS
jgi:phosphomannomutase